MNRKLLEDLGWQLDHQYKYMNMYVYILKEPKYDDIYYYSLNVWHDIITIKCMYDTIFKGKLSTKDELSILMKQLEIT